MNKFQLSDIIPTMTQKVLNRRRLLPVPGVEQINPLREPRHAGVHICRRMFSVQSINYDVLRDVSVYREHRHKQICIEYA